MASSSNVPISTEIIDTAEVEVDDALGSIMVTVSVMNPDGRSYQASGHLVVDENGVDEHTVAEMVVRSALGASMAHGEDLWLALRKALVDYGMA